MIESDFLDAGRLAIRPFEPSDQSALVALFADPEVARYVGDGTALSPDEAARWIEQSGLNLARFGYGTGAVVEKSTGEMVGWAGFGRPGGTEEIVYGLLKSRWGRGYGGEIVDALLAFASARGIAPVRATVDVANAGSIAILDGRGFRLAERDYNGEAGCCLYLKD